MTYFDTLILTLNPSISFPETKSIRNQIFSQMVNFIGYPSNFLLCTPNLKIVVLYQDFKNIWPTGQCDLQTVWFTGEYHIQVNVNYGKTFYTKQCDLWDNVNYRRTLRPARGQCDLQENVTSGTMWPIGQCVQKEMWPTGQFDLKDNVTYWTIWPTGQCGF